ncbi:MAG: DinB family protein [Candidatus Acidiferrales bacterium]
MTLNLRLNDLLDYAEWERQKWHDWFRQHGDQILKTSAGPHGDGRFDSVGDLVKHIFSAEKRYIDRLSGRELTDAAIIPNDNIEALFQFGQQSRKDLTEFVEAFPAQEWDIPQDFKILKYFLKATPKKIVLHVVMHEIRHWAQVATLFRLDGFKGEFHDFLFSPVMGGEFRSEEAKA